jgi:hypothetical protein
LVIWEQQFPLIATNACKITMYIHTYAPSVA